MACDVDMTCNPAVEMVKEYCLAHREVDLHTTAITFSELAASDLSRSAFLPQNLMPWWS